MSNSSLSELNENNNVHVKDLDQLFYANILSLNSKETKLGPWHRRQDISCYSIEIGSIELDRIGNNCNEQATKILGMHIDETLT